MYKGTVKHVICLDNLTYAYRAKKRWFSSAETVDKQVLKGVTMWIERGELYGLVGPNGSGKTTLTKLLIGVYEPDAGRIEWDGRPRPKLENPLWKEKIGLLSGSAMRLFATVDFREHIALYKHLYRTFDEAWLMELLEEFHLQDKLNKLPTSVSFGERIKFELALTLAYRPEILILDEPTVGLDPGAILQVRTAISRYVRDHRASGILTSHNLRDITEICARGGFLNDGRISEEFESEQVDAHHLEERFLEVFGSA